MNSSETIKIFDWSKKHGISPMIVTKLLAAKGVRVNSFYTVVSIEQLESIREHALAESNGTTMKFQIKKAPVESTPKEIITLGLRLEFPHQSKEWTGKTESIKRLVSIGKRALRKLNIGENEPEILDPESKDAEWLDSFIIVFLDEGSVYQARISHVGQQEKEKPFLSILLDNLGENLPEYTTKWTINLRGTVIFGRNPLLSIKSIDLLPHTDRRDFEFEAMVKLLRPNTFWQAGVLLTPEFTEKLPHIRQATEEKAAQWLKFLDWKNDYLESRIRDYLLWPDQENNTSQLKLFESALAPFVEGKFKADVSTLQIPKYQSFYLFSEGRSDSEKILKQAIQQDELYWVDLKEPIDLNDIVYEDELFEDDGITTRLDQLLQFNKKSENLVEIDTKWQVAKNVNTQNHWALADWKAKNRNSILYLVRVHYSENEIRYLKSLLENEEWESAKTAFRTMQKTTLHLAHNNAKGDKALTGRHKKSIERLLNESGNAPFLTTWLFDIAKARSTQTNPQEITHWGRKDLNDSQKKALQKILAAQDIALLQGPPGTGKTTVIAEAVYQLALRGERVLLLSQAHLAVDNVLERLADLPEIRAIRIGKVDKISESLQHLTSENIFSNAMKKSTRLVKSNQYDLRLRRILSIEWKNWISRVEESEGLLHKSQEYLHSIQAEHQSLETALANKRKHLQNEQQRVLLENERAQRTQQLFVFLETPHNPMSLLDEKTISILEPLISRMDSLRIVFPKLGSQKLLPLTSHRELLAKLFEEQYRQLARILLVMKKIQQWLENPSDTQFLTPEQQSQFSVLERKISELQQVLDNPDDSQSDSDLSQCLKQRNAVRKELETLRQSSGVPDFDGVFKDEPWRNDPAQAKVAYQNIHNELKIIYNLLKNLFHTLSTNDQKANLNTQPIQLQKEVELAEATYARSLNNIELCNKQLLLNQKELRSLNESFADWKRTHSIAANLSIAEFKPSTEELHLEKLQQKWLASQDTPEKEPGNKDQYEEIIKRWINVVAATCNERPESFESLGFFDFDTVIIDEVSKAMPVELIPGMLMGRRTILVGDHRQLPPVFNIRSDEITFKQALEECEESGQEQLITREDFNSFENMVTASLFRDYFERADDQIKTGLFDQYRMHPQIMDMVNHFYEGRLECGLRNPDECRAHQMNLSDRNKQIFIKPQDHAIWVDSSFDRHGVARIEDQKGTSKFNLYEVELARTVLLKMEAECRSLNLKKTVSVISFYAAQVFELRNAVRSLELKHLTVEVNTVDRFQGKESQIILVSLVRNPPNGHAGKNTFVAQFERINVAFSRAQELLVVFGAASLFSKYQVDLPAMNGTGTKTDKVYGKIIAQLQQAGRFVNNGRLDP